MFNSGTLEIVAPSPRNNNPKISKDLLDVIHDQNMESNLSLIEKESDIF